MAENQRSPVQLHWVCAILETVIQEIVDRAGWSSGNSILLVLYTPTQNKNSPIEARFGTKDGSTDESAQLEITV